MKNYLLKIRGGVEVDSYGKKAGKGALIAEEISHTLGTSQDQYLFQSIGFSAENSSNARSIGAVMEQSPTIRAGRVQSVAIHKKDPFVCLEGNGSRPSHRGNGWKVSETMYTLNTTEVHSVAYAVENHPADSRVDIDESGTCQTLTSRMGTGGGNVPLVLFAKKRGE